MNEKQLLKDYENMTDDQKETFHTLLHTIKLLAKVNNLSEDVAFELINKTFTEVADVKPKNSLVVSLTRTIDVAVSQCFNKLEELRFGDQPANYTHGRWIV